MSKRKPTALTHRLLQQRRPHAHIANPFDLDRRRDLPQEWLFLLNNHSREDWLTHRSFGPLTETWLNRHDGFRNSGNALISLLRQFREDMIPAETFGGMFAPRLQHFVSELHTHHMNEDHHYFPVLMEVEPRLMPGFELLEADHEALHHRTESVIESANALLHRLQDADKTAIRRATDDFSATSDALFLGLKRHLADEEDLIVPIILDRGEGDIGLS